MVGKPHRKKQAVSLSAVDRSSDAVSVSLSFLLAKTNSGEESQTDTHEKELRSLPVDFQAFLASLLQEKTIAGQVRILQSQKRKMRALLLSDSLSLSAHSLQLCVSVLLRLYLFPAFYVFQTNMEWLGACLAELLSRTDAEKAQVLSCLSSVSEEVLSLAHRDLSPFTAVDTHAALHWLPTLSALAALDRECGGLRAQPALLSRFVTLSASLFAFAANELCASASSSAAVTTTAAVTAEEGEEETVTAAPQLVAWSQVCTETARHVVSVLKPLLSSPASVPVAVPASLLPTLHTLLQHSWQLLCVEHTHSAKDAHTSAGAAVVLALSLLLHNAHTQESESGAHTATAVNETMHAFVRVLCGGDDESLSAISSLAPFVTVAQVRVLPTVSLCALLRGAVQLLYAGLLQQPSVSSSPLRSLLYFEEMLSTLTGLCERGKSSDQLYALQTLEVWLARVCDVWRRSPTPSAPCESESESALWRTQQLTVARALRVSAVLCGAWTHPSRQVSHLVPAVFELLVKTLLTAYSPDNAPSENTNTAESVWSALLTQISRMPSFHRGKYQALTVLLTHLGCESVLREQPQLVHELVRAMKERDISAAVATLVVALAKSLLSLSALREKEKGTALTVTASVSVVSLWQGPVTEALMCESDKSWRNNVADYLLPDLLKLESDAGTRVLAALPTHTHTHEEDFADDVGTLWCVVQIVQHTKLLGQSLPSSESALYARVQRALSVAAVAADDQLRLGALLALTLSLRTSVPITREDLDLCKKSLFLSLKTADPDQCSRVARAVRSVVLRAKHQAKTGGPTGLQLFEEVLGWIFEEVQRNLYPGVPFDREYSALHLLKTLLDALRENTSNAEIDAKIEVLLAHRVSASLVDSLINAFLSSWDKSRRVAAELLLYMPRPWPGYASVSGADSVQQLVLYARTLAESARLRESDCGATLLCSVFSVYCVSLGWDISPNRDGTTSDEESLIARDDKVSGVAHDKKKKKKGASSVIPIGLSTGADDNTRTHVPTTAEVLRSSASFVRYLLHRLEEALDELERIFSSLFAPTQLTESGESEREAVSEGVDFPLAHGLLLSVKLCLLSLDREGLLRDSPSLAHYWRTQTGLLTRVRESAERALRVASTVVAEAQSDVPFAPAPCNSGVTTKGPVNSMSVTPGAQPQPQGHNMAASYVNTNSLMSGVSTEEDGSGTDAVTLGARAQRAVVGAWLLVKESTSLLATLVEISPLMSSPIASEGVVESERESEACVLLTADETERIGYLLLDALGRLKHMGAIAETHVALQSVATQLLRCDTATHTTSNTQTLTHTETQTRLSALPGVWLAQLLRRLSSHSQVFILRRSAGFAYSFLSLLRAEPVNGTPALLQCACETLLRIVREGVAHSDATTHTHTCTDAEAWKLSVHALNVLRLIVLDAAFHHELDVYLPETLSLAVRGFSSPHWAVRNSSMMAFSSVIQRAIAKEKNDLSGTSSVTAADFFARFNKQDLVISNNDQNTTGSLFDFLLTALDKATLHQNEEVQQALLYPLLLLFAKFRAPMFPSQHTQTKTDAESLAQAADVSLALPLIARCARSPLQYVRSMAGRAYSALVALTDMPRVVLTQLRALVSALHAHTTAHTHKLTANEVHGRLCVLHELVKQTLTHRSHSGSGANHAFFLEIENAFFGAPTQGESGVGVCELLQQLLTLLTPRALLSLSRCAAVHHTLLSLLRATHSLATQPAHTMRTHELLLCEAQTCVGWLADTDTLAQKRLCEPYAPWTVREALSVCVTHTLSQCVSEPESGAREELHALLSLLTHKVTEVREGVTRGVQQFLRAHTHSESESMSVCVSAKVRELCESSVWGASVSALERETEPELSQLMLDNVYRMLSLTSDDNALPVSATLPEPVRLTLLTVLYRLITHDATLSLTESDTPLRVLVWRAENCQAIESFSQLVRTTLEKMLSLLSVTDLTASQLAELRVSVRVSTHWLRVLTLAAHEDQPVDLRESAARGLSHSAFLSLHTRSLLTQTQTELSRLSEAQREITETWQAMALDVLLCVGDLLQDDDDDVRACANETLCAAVRESDAHAVHAVTTASYSLQEYLPVCLERLLSHTTQYCSAAFAHTQREKVLSKLLAVMGSEDSVRMIVRSSQKQLSQKIFEAEQSNLFVESLKAGESLIATLAPSLPRTDSARVVDITERALTLLAECVTAHTENVNCVAVGGLTYDQDVFRFLFLSLRLCARSLSHNAQACELLAQSECERLARSLSLLESAQSALIHPLLRTELRVLRTIVG